MDAEVLSTQISKMLSTVLTAREERIIRLRFGLNGDEPRTLRTIGEELGVTGARVRQIEQRALRKLRHPRRGMTR